MTMLNFIYMKWREPDVFQKNGLPERPTMIFNKDIFLRMHRHPDVRLSAEGITSSAKELADAGIHLHLEEFEIESGLFISGISNAGQALATLRNGLEQRGYTFLELNEIVRSNYVCYYVDQAGNKSKIVVRNNGDGGYQFKKKSKLAGVSDGIVRVRREARGIMKSTLAEAETELPIEMCQDPVLILEVAKRKLTLCARGGDNVIRYFRLSVDESSVPENAEEKLYQIALEYKGSNQEQEDDLSSVQKVTRGVVESIQSIKGLDTKRSIKSKFKWGMEKLSRPLVEGVS